MLTAVKARPFLKWAGGKAKLLGDLGPMVPRFTGRYFEPFIGGGAMFFHLAPRQATISDINPELINVYKVVRDSVGPLIDDLQTHINQSDYFYELRSWDRDLISFNQIDPIKRASRFIFLNKTCFNGLWRENLDGEMNAPFGKYKRPNWCDSDNLRAVSERLQGIDIKCMSFSGLLTLDKPPGPGDFVYFDPPYAPINQDSFTSYTRHGFDMADQMTLLDLCNELDRNGAKFMLSNSSALILREMYSNYTIQTVYAARAINSKGSERGAVPEIVVRNF